MGPTLSNRKVQIAVVCMLAGVVAYNVFHFALRKPRKRSLLYEEAVIDIDLGSAADPNWATGEYEAAASWGRNPFTGGDMVLQAASAKPLALQATPAPRTGSPGVRITGVMISEDERYVLVGDLLLREGDRLGAGRIKLINRDSVVVEYETGTKTIYID